MEEVYTYIHVQWNPCNLDNNETKEISEVSLFHCMKETVRGERIFLLELSSFQGCPWEEVQL